MDKHTKYLIITALMLIKQYVLQQKNGSKDHPAFGSTFFQYVHQNFHLGESETNRISQVERDFIIVHTYSLFCLSIPELTRGL